MIVLNSYPDDTDIENFKQEKISLPFQKIAQ